MPELFIKAEKKRPASIEKPIEGMYRYLSAIENSPRAPMFMTGAREMNVHARQKAAVFLLPR